MSIELFSHFELLVSECSCVHFYLIVTFIVSMEGEGLALRMKCKMPSTQSHCPTAFEASAISIVIGSFFLIRTVDVIKV